LQSGDAAGAVNVLKAVTSREPRNGRTWRNLGVAYQQVKDPDNAIAAFQRSLEVQPEMPAPFYNIAIIYAAKQDADHAFEWLGKAKATRKIDMTQAEAAPELAPSAPIADGSVDLLIPSAWSGIHGYHSGRIFLISSGIAKNAAPKE